MSDEELQVFLDAFALSGFTGGINWYRNLSRNWKTMGAYEQHIYQPTLAIFGDYDMVPKSKTLAERVSTLEVVELPCGHWIQQEMPKETNRRHLEMARSSLRWVIRLGRGQSTSSELTPLPARCAQSSTN